MPKKIIKKMFQQSEERVIVISVLGPQSSGKSTLLNFLFGCDFAVSEGRCTRGIYGTYFKFNKEKKAMKKFKNCDGVFVLDTEGLFSIVN
jgi:ABC-type lipoprotein export system ATPase subunit